MHSSADHDVGVGCEFTKVFGDLATKQAATTFGYWYGWQSTGRRVFTRKRQIVLFASNAAACFGPHSSGARMNTPVRLVFCDCGTRHVALASKAELLGCRALLEMYRASVVWQSTRF